MDITTGDIKFMGEIVGGTIILGDAESEPIFGVTALDLKRMPVIRLKRARMLGVTRDF